MKATEKMIDAEKSESSLSPLWHSVFGAAGFSGMITVAFLLASLGSSGTWLDPRVWSGSYVPGDTIASSANNGAWMIDAAVSAAPWVFAGLWGCIVAFMFIAKKFTKT